MNRSAPHQDEARHVLVIEDEPQLRSMLTDNLEFEGYHVTAVASGEEGKWAGREVDDLATLQAFAQVGLNPIAGSGWSTFEFGIHGGASGKPKSYTEGPDELQAQPGCEDSGRRGVAIQLGPIDSAAIGRCL